MGVSFKNNGSMNFFLEDTHEGLKYTCTKNQKEEEILKEYSSILNYLQLKIESFSSNPAVTNYLYNQHQMTVPRLSAITRVDCS